MAKLLTLLPNDDRLAAAGRVLAAVTGIALIVVAAFVNRLGI
jgi:hypothetical protein